MIVKISSLFTKKYLFLPLNALIISFLIFAGCGRDVISPDVSRSAPDFTGEEIFRGLILADGEVAEMIPEIRDHYLISDYITDQEKLEAVRDFNTQLIESIRQSQPSFFASFKATMQSGDHLRIEKEFEKVSEVLLTGIHQMPAIAKLRKEIQKAPSLKEELAERLSQSQRPEAKNFSKEEYKWVINNYIAQSVSKDPTTGETSLSKDNNLIPTGTCAVVALVAWIWVAAAQDIAVVWVAAGAINVALVVVAWVEVVGPEEEQAKSSLFKEQLIHSIATNLGG